MSEDTKQARVAYLAMLKEEFRRNWPSGCVRSSEPGEGEAFRHLRGQIAHLDSVVRQDLGI